MTTDRNQTISESDCRRFFRLRSVFPVEFNVLHMDHNLSPGFSWVEGVTRDVSRSGMCLETEALNESTIKYLRQDNTSLELKIKIPLGKPPIRAVAKLAWHEPDPDRPGGFILGLDFKTISQPDIQRILRHAHWFHKAVYWSLAMSLAILSALIIFSLLEFIGQ